MGDADNNQILLPVQEIESWMDEALEEVDSGLDHLFSFVNDVNEHTKHALSKVRIVENLQHCFYAMNLFVVPVILAIGLCFGTRENIDKSGLENGLEMMVKFLMYISASIGFPLYVYTLWESLRFAMKQEECCCCSSYHKGFMEEADDEMEDSDFVLPKSDESSQRLTDFTQRIDSRKLEGMRLDLESRATQRSSEVDEEREQHVVKSVGENDIFEDAMPTAVVVDSDRMKSLHEETSSNMESETFSESTQFIKNTIAQENLDFSGVRVFIINSNPDLSIKIEPKQKDSEEKIPVEIVDAYKEEVQEHSSQEDGSETTSTREFQEDVLSMKHELEEDSQNDILIFVDTNS